VPLLITPTTLEAQDSDQYTPLHLAAKLGKTKAADVLVAAGASLGRSGSAFGPLWAAFTALADGGPPELALLLFNAALSDPGWAQLVTQAVTWTDSDGQTALHLAAAAGSQELVAKLVQAGADRNAVCQSGDTPLHIAVAAGHADLVPLLITPTTLEAQDSDQYTPLQLAARLGVNEAAAALVAAGASLGAPNIASGLLWSAFKASFLGGRHELALLLFDAAMSNPRHAQLVEQAVRWTNIHGQTALHLAAAAGSQGLVAKLVQAGADRNAVSKSRSTPLHMAVAAGHADLVPLLITPTALEWEDSKKCTPLHLAARLGRKEAAAALVAAGASLGGPGRAYGALLSAFSVTAPGTSPELALLLFDAALGDPGSAQLVEQAVKWTNSHGKTPLHLAAAAGRQELVAKLVQAGADRNAGCLSGGTPLWLAAAAGYAALVPLLAIPSNINLAGPTLLRPLVAAVQRGDGQVVAALLAAGADPNAADTSGSSALVLAVQQGHYSMAQALLAAGAKPDSSNSSGKSALYVAMRCGQPQMVPLVLRALGKECGEQQRHRLLQLVAVELMPMVLTAGHMPRCVQLLEVLLDVLGPQLTGKVCEKVQLLLRQELEQPPGEGPGLISNRQRQLYSQVSYLAEALLLGWLETEERLHAGRQPLVARLQRLVPGVPGAKRVSVQRRRCFRDQLQQLVQMATVYFAEERLATRVPYLEQLAALHVQHSSNRGGAMDGAGGAAQVILAGMWSAAMESMPCRRFASHEEYLRFSQQACSFRRPGVYTTFMGAWVRARRQLQQLPQEMAGVTVAAILSPELDRLQRRRVLANLKRGVQQGLLWLALRGIDAAEAAARQAGRHGRGKGALRLVLVGTASALVGAAAAVLTG
jgi:cytohesin